jgi:hypothetical protein
MAAVGTGVGVRVGCEGGWVLVGVNVSVGVGEGPKEDKVAVASGVSLAAAGVALGASACSGTTSSPAEAVPSAAARAATVSAIQVGTISVGGKVAFDTASGFEQPLSQAARRIKAASKRFIRMPAALDIETEDDR